MRIIGYTHDAACYCRDHAPSKDSPIFEGEEFDSIPCCDICGEPLDATLTSEGTELVFNVLLDIKDEYMKEWYIEVLRRHGYRT